MYQYFIFNREYKHNSLLEAYGARHVNAIVDQFKSLKEVTQAVRSAGLESSNLIFGKILKYINIVHCQCFEFLNRVN